MAEKSTIARPYAQAIFSLAVDQKRLAEWSDQLALTTLVVTDQNLAALIGNPRIAKEKIGALVIDVCGDKLDQAGQDMIRVLVDNDRLELMPEICLQFEAYRAEAEKVVQAHVTAAFPVSEEQKAGIIAALKKRLGREVTLECQIDKTLLGGAIIRAGDMVIDGSITGHLDRMAHALSQ
jgi:F-type H+-transporting ATPase subunit delta